MSESDEIEEMIKSTENSINETCKLLQDIPFINKKSADEMFEELGYEKIDKKMLKNIIFTDGNKKFYFHKIYKKIKCAEYDKEERTFMESYFTIKELEAIYKYCQEQRWIGGEDE